jgi:hypothetical protein
LVRIELSGLGILQAAATVDRLTHGSTAYLEAA